MSAREEFKRKIRIACQAFNVHRLLWPQLRELDRVTLYKYVSHKLIRWFTIYFLAIAASAFEAALIVSGHARVAVALLVCTAAGLLLGCISTMKPFAQIGRSHRSLYGHRLGCVALFARRTLSDMDSCRVDPEVTPQPLPSASNMQREISADKQQNVNVALNGYGGSFR